MKIIKIKCTRVKTQHSVFAYFVKAQNIARESNLKSRFHNTIYTNTCTRNPLALHLFLPPLHSLCMHVPQLHKHTLIEIFVAAYRALYSDGSTLYYLHMRVRELTWQKLEYNLTRIRYVLCLNKPWCVCTYTHLVSYESVRYALGPHNNTGSLFARV